MYVTFRYKKQDGPTHLGITSRQYVKVWVTKEGSVWKERRVTSPELWGCPLLVGQVKEEEPAKEMEREWITREVGQEPADNSVLEAKVKKYFKEKGTKSVKCY